jgi:GT2 family glycosyltransferase
MIVSFIIPARNEAALIRDAVENIRQCAPRDTPWELLIVDNGSTDATFAVAQSFPDARVLRANGTVGKARNEGAAAAKGDVLVFLDADVRLTPAWQREIGRLLVELQSVPRLVTGSTVTIPANPTLIEQHWFLPATFQTRQYVNSGHLIIGRSLFDELAGFDPQLRTGEDFDLCRRARAAGATVRDDRALEAIHLGFPKTLSAFARRELWHGQGDGGGFARILRSKVALLSVAVALLTFGGPLLSFLLQSPLPAAIGIGTGALISLLCGIRRSRNVSPVSWLVNAALYYVYFLARAAALLFRFDGWRQRHTTGTAVKTNR